MENKLDKYLGKWSSRKLVVLIIATSLTIADKLDGSDWAYIAMAYVFVQGVLDAKEYFKKSN